MDTKRKRYTLGEFLRAAETWINVIIESDRMKGSILSLHFTLLSPDELEDILLLALW